MYIVHHHHVQIMSVPGYYPKIGKIPCLPGALLNAVAYLTWADPLAHLVCF